jgi:hypothetical protein
MTTWGTIELPGAPPEAPQPRPKLPAWSYSRLSKWEKCPASAYYAFILRIQEPKSEAMERGTLAHAQAAAIIMGERTPEPTLLSLPWQTRLAVIGSDHKGDIEVELQAAFRADWTRTDWFARDAWCRVIFDAFAYAPGAPIVVNEHKTGKPRAEHTAQASLYAAAASLMIPDVPVDVYINYLDLSPHTPQGRVLHKFSAEFAKKQVATWEGRVLPMMNDTDYPATPGNQCRWCSFAASKGGPCEKA